MERISALWKANTIAFISSFCVMVIELVAARLLAPYIGVSLYTWTSIIGAIRYIDLNSGPGPYGGPDSQLGRSRMP